MTALSQSTVVALAVAGIAVAVAVVALARRVLAIVDRQRLRRAQRIDADSTQREVRRLREFYEAVSSGVVVRNAAGAITFANRPACAMLHLPPDADAMSPGTLPVALLDDTGRVLLPDELPSVVARRTKRSLHGQILGVRVADTVERWLLADAVPMIDPITGDAEEVIISFVDVTARRHADERLRESEERFRTMVDSLLDGVVLQLADFSIAMCNASAIRITGLTPDQMVGRAPRPPHWTAIREDGERFLLSDHPSPLALRTGRSASAMLGVCNGLEETRWIHINTRPLFRDGETKPYAALSSVTDVTERVRAEAAQRIAREAAEAASRFKSEFLANTSHEIRTPMNGVLGMLELARASTAPAEQRAHLDLALSSARSLLAIINDILDFSKVEAGHLELHAHPFALADCLYGVVDPLAPRAREKGLDLQLRIAPSVPSGIIGDALRLRQVVTNLVGNAIKFTARGEIVISVTVDESLREPDVVMLHVAVRDTGIGIPREKLAIVFEAFTQADGSTAREYGGTGLGLTISAHLVALMGGRIWCESEVGRGSTFHFTARVGTSETVSAALAAESVSERADRADIMDVRTAHPCHVLLAEDNLVNQALATAVLERWGHRVVVAGDGRAALDAHERERFDVVLMDVQMPHVDGLEATAVIRDRERRSAVRVAIIAMTARTMAGDRERCLAAGMDGYVGKPYDLEELFHAIEAIGARRDRAAAPNEHDAVDRPAMRVHRGEAHAAEPSPIDARALLVAAGGSTRMLADLVALFREQVERLVADARRAVARGAAGEVELAARALRKSFDDLKAARGAAMAQELEALARNGALQSATALCLRIDHEVESVSRAIFQLAGAA